MILKVVTSAKKADEPKKNIFHGNQQSSKSPKRISYTFYTVGFYTVNFYTVQFLYGQNLYGRILYGQNLYSSKFIRFKLYTGQNLYRSKFIQVKIYTVNFYTVQILYRQQSILF
jgi:hypothetical protein